MSLSIAFPSDHLPQPTSRRRRTLAHVEEVVAVQDVLQPFKQAVDTFDQPTLQLLCTVPTWSSSPIHCLDLHDLHDLRNRSIVFVHELLKLLRANGIEASYRLIPSSVDLAAVSISSSETSQQQPPIDHELLATAQTIEHGKTLLARAKEGPVVIMT